jgi:hypothetical protein
MGYFCKFLKAVHSKLSPNGRIAQSGHPGYRVKQRSFSHNEMLNVCCQTTLRQWRILVNKYAIADSF